MFRSIILRNINSFLKRYPRSLYRIMDILTFCFTLSNVQLTREKTMTFILAYTKLSCVIIIIILLFLLLFKHTPISFIKQIDKLLPSIQKVEAISKFQSLPCCWGTGFSWTCLLGWKLVRWRMVFADFFLVGVSVCNLSFWFLVCGTNIFAQVFD